MFCMWGGGEAILLQKSEKVFFLYCLFFLSLPRKIVLGRGRGGGVGGEEVIWK